MPPRSRAERAAISAGMHGPKPHPFVRAVLAHPRYGSVASWARAKRLPVSTVASWYCAKRRKSIPRKWADLIASEFVDAATKETLVPADSSTWPGGVL